MGLLYQNPDVPAYEEIRWQRQDRPDHRTFLERLDAAMDRYTVT
jgi:N-acetyl-beta-hexosaminidase